MSDLAVIPIVLAFSFACALVVGMLLALWPRRSARKRRGPTSLALASLMFGFGSVMDGPTRHVIEAKQAKAEDEDPGADPPET